MPTPTTQTNPGLTAAPKPLTDPADLLRLLGRFVASLILLIFVLIHIFQQNVGAALIAGVLSLLVQWSTIRLWRRLRDERIAAKEAQEAQQNRAIAQGGPR